MYTYNDILYITIIYYIYVQLYIIIIYYNYNFPYYINYYFIVMV